MADSPVFTFVSEELERRTSLSALEARGTLRLALKTAGIEARSVTGEQMRVVLSRLLPEELRSRGCDDHDDVCQAIRDALARQRFQESAGETPDAVFARLGGTA